MGWRSSASGWSDQGAHLLAQVRVKLLNDELVARSADPMAATQAIVRSGMGCIPPVEGSVAPHFGPLSSTIVEQNADVTRLPPSMRIQHRKIQYPLVGTQ